MKSIILIGGFGTRLEPLTVTRPKTMVPVLNRPFLELIIQRLRDCGIKDIVLSLGHLPDCIIDYFGNGSKLGVNLQYVVEDKPLGTGGGIKNAQKYLDETFLVVNGDVFTDINITKMTDFHTNKNALATIALIPVNDPSRYGVIEADETGRVKKFLEKPGIHEITTALINAGLIIMEPSILDYIPNNKKFSYEKELFPALIDNNKPIYSFASSDYWIDIGKPEKYFQLNTDLLKGQSVQYQPQSSSAIYVDPDAKIGNNVHLSGTVVIGPGSIIGDNCRINDCILWENSFIGWNSVLDSSIIANDCHIGSDCCINQSVIGSNVVIAKEVTISNNSRIYPYSKIN